MITLEDISKYFNMTKPSISDLLRAAQKRVLDEHFKK